MSITLPVDLNTKFNDKISKAIAQAGADAELIGFEAAEIQRFVMANSRPYAIQGASGSLQDFDSENNQHPGEIFAGGARGLLIVSKASVDSEIKRLENDFKQRTTGLSLAIAHAPFKHNRQAESLQLLWLRQRAAHDRCAPEKIELDFSKGVCADCRARPGTHDSPFSDAENKKVCERCLDLIKLGKKAWKDKEGRSLCDLLENPAVNGNLPYKSLIALVCADGNRLGNFFHSLESLSAIAGGSWVIKEIFQNAHKTAVKECKAKRYLDPVTGGDDIKVFLAPEYALEYASTLIEAVEQNADSVGNLAGLLGEKPAQALASLGIGVGILIAPVFLPVRMLTDMALRLEHNAKTLCSHKNKRSAVAVGVLKSESERQNFDDPAISGNEWRQFVRKIKCLREVPRHQRAIIASAYEHDELERQNLFCYQVARSEKWQEWFKNCGIDWTSRTALVQNFPTTSMLALAGIGRNPT